MADYRRYDECDRDSLSLDFFEGFRSLVLEEANEYTVALARVALAFTELDVWSPDERMRWFCAPHPRLHDGMPDACDPAGTITVTKAFGMGLSTSDDVRLSATYAFHNVFFLQWMLDGRRLSQFRYATVEMHPSEGIASLLMNTSRYQAVFDAIGLRFCALGVRHGPYLVSMLDRYFSLDLAADDATEENTLRVPSQPILQKTRMVFSSSGMGGRALLRDAFRSHIDEYYEAVFGSGRVLGVLIRGTDYVTSNFVGARKPATVDEMLPLLRDWMETDGYDRMFLATEDLDVLMRMRAEFGHKVVAIAQRRHRVSDLRKGQVLQELAQESAPSQEALDEQTEETVVNYLYALHILSRCESFVCSSQTNGFDLVCKMNEGRFRRIHRFQVALSRGQTRQ